jgi:hypothetical protein
VGNRFIPDANQAGFLNFPAQAMSRSNILFWAVIEHPLESAGQLIGIEGNSE